MSFTFDSPSVAAFAILLLKATVLLLAALGASLVMQRASAGARHMVWVAIVGALLVLPALTAWSPLRLGILPASPVAGESITGHLTSSSISSPVEQSSAPQTPLPNATDNTVSAGINEAAPSSISLWQALGMIWAVVALAVAAWLTIGFFAVRRIVRRAQLLEDKTWTFPLYEIADRLGIDATPRLMRSEDVKMPFACGLLTPTIILPADSESWDLERRRAVLMHELAHIRRRDLVGHTLGRIACAVYWFHPLVWTAVRRLRIESERACDDLALVSGLRPSNYAEHLLDIVSSIGRTRTPAIAIPMAHRREFEGRMLAILDPDVRRRVERRQSAGILVALAALVFVVSAAVPAERSIAATPQETTTGIAADTPISQDVALGAQSRTQDRRGQPRQQPSAQLPQQPRSQGAQPPVQPEYQDEVEREDDLRDLVQDTARDDRAVLLVGILRSDTSASLRRVAAWGLSRYADRADVATALANAIRRDNNSSVREMAAWSAAHGSERSDVIEALSDALRRDSDVEVRETAAWSLGNLDAEAAAEALTDALTSQSKTLRMLALWALGNASPKTAPRGVVNALSDPEPRVRDLAAWALYRIEDAETVPALEQALNREQDRHLRMSYIRALGAIGERSSPALARLLDSRDQEVRAMVVSALAGRGGGPWPWPWPNPRPSP